MTKGFLILAMAFIVSSAKAESTPVDTQLTDEERLQIALALHTLAKYKVILPDENKCVQFNNNILKRIQSEGLLTNDSVKLMTVCIGAGN